MGKLDHNLQAQICEVLGDTIPHVGDYEIDARWLESLLNYYWYRGDLVGFRTHTARGISGVQPLASPGTAIELRIALDGHAIDSRAT